MPNHIKNRIELIGTKEDIKAILEKYSTHYPSEKSRAYNDELICTNGSEYGWLNEDTNVFTRRNQDSVIGIPEGFEVEIKAAWTRFPDFNKVLPMPKAIENTFGDSGSNPAWYDWSINNWGTKWNSYSCKEESRTVHIFETAWSCVPKILEEISLNFPNVEITYEYSDEDTSYNCGVIKLKNGIVDAVKLEGGSKEAYDLYFKLRPEDKEYYKLVGDNYQYIDED